MVYIKVHILMCFPLCPVCKGVCVCVCVRRAGTWCYAVTERGCTPALGCMQKVTETLIKKKKVPTRG